jgi:hypothetical protein
MPATTVPGLILFDAFGRPAHYTGHLYRRTTDDARLRPPPPNHFNDYAALLAPHNLRRLVSECRALASRGLVSAAIDQLAGYAGRSGWVPYFTGEDSAWGERAEQWLADTAAACTQLGAGCDWRSLWRASVRARKSDGMLAIILTESVSGWPLLQPIEAHRIGQRDENQSTVGPDDAWTALVTDDGLDYQRTPTGRVRYARGVYSGLSISSGVITAPSGAAVAYRILGPTPAEDYDISARDIVIVSSRRWISEVRPVPEIAPALLDLLAIDLARQGQLDQQILDSRLTLIEKTASGARDSAYDALNPSPAGTTDAGSPVEVYERTATRFIKTDHDLTPHEAQRPSDQWMNYDLRIASTAVAAMGWRLEMLDPSALRGAATRAFQDQINTTIADNYLDTRPAVIRCTQYRIAKAIRIGALPPHHEALSWDVTEPPEFVVDRNATRIDIEAVRAGADAMPFVLRRGGLRPRQTLTAQARYIALRDEVAAAYGVNPEQLGTSIQLGDSAQAAAALTTTTTDDGGRPPAA